MPRVPTKAITPKSSSSSPKIDHPGKHIDFLRKSHKRRYLESKHKTFIPSPTISLDAIAKVNIKEDVISLLEGAKLGILSRPRNVEQFEIPTREFVASFEEYNDEVGRGWTFQLGGKSFRKTREEICVLFGFSIDDVMDEEFDVHEKDDFWKEIAEMDHFVSLMSPKITKLGVWKYIHRLISMTFFTRLDSARYVQNRDFDTILVIKKEKPVNAYAHLTEWFTTWSDPKSDNKAIGGGLLVSLLAQNLRINLVPSGKGHSKRLDMNSMASSKMWCKKTSSWIHELEITERIHKTLQGRLIREEAAKQRRGKTYDPNGAKVKVPTLSDFATLEKDIRAHMEESYTFMDTVCDFMAKMLKAEDRRVADDERRAKDEMILAALRNRDTAPSTSAILPPTPTDMELFEALLSGDPLSDTAPL